jgi:hypothetical protein
VTSVRRHIGDLLALQHKSGAFQSTVECDGAVREDWNGFVTALVLRAMSNVKDPAWKPAQKRALDFVASCESPYLHGAYCFWPDRGRPSWAPQLVADADDTALIVVALLRGGRITLGRARQIVSSVLLKYCIPINALRPSWARVGAFKTWLCDNVPEGSIDCCVNANVLALIAETGLCRVSAFQTSVGMIDTAVRRGVAAGEDTCSLTPYYPHSQEFAVALAHCVAAGIHGLAPAAAIVRRQVDGGDDGSRPLCCSIDGRLVWSSAAVRIARAIAVSASS